MKCKCGWKLPISGKPIKKTNSQAAKDRSHWAFHCLDCGCVTRVKI